MLSTFAITQMLQEKFYIKKLTNIFIYIVSRRKCSSDKAESIPFLNPVVTASPPAPSQSGTSTVNRTLLHHQQVHGTNGVNTTARKSTTAAMRGLAISYNNEPPPPDYNIVVHDTRRHDLLLLYFLFNFIFL